MPFIFHTQKQHSSYIEKIEERHKEYLQTFKYFAEYETLINKKTLNGSSGKASSYYRYLRSTIINYEEYYDDKIQCLGEIESYNLLSILLSNPQFITLNKKHNSFYTATLACYKRFTEFIQNNSADEILNILSDVITDEPKQTFNSTKHSKIPANKKFSTNTNRYPRNIKESSNAKINSDWLCEFDPNHRTFINTLNQKNYIEAHHLIPLSNQDDFTYSIDISANIVCLCPNCHRQIHHGLPNDRKILLQKLYKSRKQEYPKYGIDITLEKLLTYYNI